MDKSKLEDVLNYQMQDYISADEMNLIRATFKSPRMMKLLRKIFLPTMADPDLPIEQLGNDMWFAGDRKWDQIPNEEAKSLIVARQEAIKFIMSSLVRLTVMANSVEETPKDKAQRMAKDSSK